jgi:hypothetical protein
MHLRLISYTSYGPMVGCLACGASWLVKAEQTGASGAGAEGSVGSPSSS